MGGAPYPKIVPLVLTHGHLTPCGVEIAMPWHRLANETHINKPASCIRVTLATSNMCQMTAYRVPCTIASAIVPATPQLKLPF